METQQKDRPQETKRTEPHNTLHDKDTQINLIIEQYKLYVEMADRVSNRRIEASKFYISILSGLLALLSVISIPLNLQDIIITAVAVLGIALCIIWIVNIRSYRELNSLKFEVIHEIERLLPFRCYDREWQILKTGSGKRKYLRLTHIEQFVPFLLMVPYILLLVYVVVY